MSARCFSLAVILALVVAAPLWAQDQAQPEVQNSRFQFTGMVNSNAVYVRSGPGENYYPTQKLDKGQSVTVVGIKFDWLKILPPEGSFCYVAKVFVDKTGEGAGRVKRADVNVRAGSNLNQSTTTVQAKLDAGADVVITGEHDEYYMIKPPAGAYWYVHKQFVDPVRAIGGPADPAAAAAPTAVAANRADSIVAPSTQPADQANVTAPATQPSEAAAAAEKFDALEAEYAANQSKSLEEQPVAEMLAEYQTLAAGDKLPESMRRMADFRVATLKQRNEARIQLLEVRKIQEQMKQRTMALKAEQVELQERLDKGVTTFTAVGTLQASSLQQGQTTLYRLTDPATGRTIVYVGSNDSKLVSMLNQFVGVRGEIATDERLNLKVITPTAMLPVDQTKVNHGVSAQIVPPSMLGNTASTGSN